MTHSMPSPEELRRQVRRLEAVYLVLYPEDADLPDAVMRRAATRIVMSRYQGVPQAFLDAFDDH